MEKQRNGSSAVEREYVKKQGSQFFVGKPKPLTRRRKAKTSTAPTIMKMRSAAGLPAVPKHKRAPK